MNKAEEQFVKRNREFIEKMANDKVLLAKTKEWFQHSSIYEYSYHFSWLGRPIIQYPQDIIAMQEIIWEVKPDLIIETGIAHGGSLIFYASMLSLLDISELRNHKNLIQLNFKRMVLGIDIEIRPHNRVAIENHPMYHHIKMIEGSSIDKNVINQVYEFAKDFKKILVCLDSNHTHEHVLSELRAYTPLVDVGSYCVVFDTVIEDMPENSFPDRPWGKGNNPKTAVWEFLKTNDNFEIDKMIENKPLITVSPDGYLKRVK